MFALSRKKIKIIVTADLWYYKWYKYATLPLRKLFPFARIHLTCISKRLRERRVNDSRDYFSRKKISQIENYLYFHGRRLSWLHVLQSPKALTFAKTANISDRVNF